MEFANSITKVSISIPPSRANTKIGYSNSKVHDGLLDILECKGQEVCALLKCARGCLSNRVKPVKPA